MFLFCGSVFGFVFCFQDDCVVIKVNYYRFIHTCSASIAIKATTYLLFRRVSPGVLHWFLENLAVPDHATDTCLSSLHLIWSVSGFLFWDLLFSPFFCRQLQIKTLSSTLSCMLFEVESVILTRVISMQCKCSCSSLKIVHVSFSWKCKN